MNRIEKLFQRKQQNILSIYFTAGFPEKDSMPQIYNELIRSGVDMLEIGIPFSDPSADGPTIQQSNQTALENGITLTHIFQQIKQLQRNETPIVLMGYLNTILQFGMEEFCKTCDAHQIDGVIIPDLPPEEYEKHYQETFEKHKLSIHFLIGPRTSMDRIKYIDNLSNGFIYAVSGNSTTGATQGKLQELDYLKPILNLQLKNPILVGFGIHNKDTFDQACKIANGAIVGSAFIKILENEPKNLSEISNFIQSFKPH